MKLKEILDKFYKTEEKFIFIRRPGWLKGYLYRVDQDGDIRDFDDSGTGYEREGIQPHDSTADDWEVVEI